MPAERTQKSKRIKSNPSRLSTRSTTSFSLPCGLNNTVDMIVRSSDGYDFRVHMTYLAAASTTFQGMFLLPPTTRNTDLDVESPVVELAERGDILEILLSCIYPLQRKRPATIELLTGSLKAAFKYDMETALSTLRPHLVWPKFLKCNPLAILSVSLQLHFRPEAEMAYQATYDMHEERLLRCDTEDMLARDLVRLLRERHDRARVMMMQLRKSIFSELPLLKPPQCEDCDTVHPWVSWWLMAAENELFQRPITDLIFSPSFLQKSKTDADVACGCERVLDDWNGELYGFKQHLDDLFPLPKLWK